MKGTTKIMRLRVIGKLFEGMMDLLYRVGKIIMWLLAVIIMSIGTVTLLNPIIQGIIFRYLPF
ncbi:hypothetical protein [Konateibacter massiliensis]|uniref:hypothetical protein n=1 Tax=Konateibacter massiliensis TaxID=2002841 RepID=UPI000C14C21E|nr:hypothetical protein [Konateibacter massiliensis]